jgi:uncharacterized membrane protein
MKTRGSWRSRNPRLADALAVAIAALLVGIPAYGVLRGDLAIPFQLSLGRPRYYHFRGAELWLIFAAFVCVGACALLEVWARRQTKPDGESARRVAAILGTAGVFVILAMMVWASYGVTQLE